MKNKTYALASIVLMTIMLSSLVVAFGVSSPYWSTNPMELGRGETETVDINLQNMVGDDDVTVKAVVIEGQDIASLSDGKYTVEAKTSDSMAPLKVKISKDAVPGETKKVKVEFKTVATNTDGMVTMGTGMTVGFDVIITEEQEKSSSPLNTTLITLAILMVLVIAVVAIKRRSASTETLN